MSFSNSLGTIQSVSGATVSQDQAEILDSVFDNPASISGHPGIAKMWCQFYGVGTAAINASYNVTSVSRTGTGVYTVTFAIPFTSSVYAALVVSNIAGLLTQTTASTLQIVTLNPGGAFADAAYVAVVAYGSQ